MLSAVVLALGLYLAGVAQDRTAPLIPDLTSEDELVRERAEDSLVEIGLDALPALLVAYNRAILPRQQAIKRVVHRMGPDVVEPLYKFSYLRRLIVGREKEMTEDGVALAIGIGEAAIPAAKALAEAPGPGNGGPRLWGGAVLAGLGPAGVRAFGEMLENADSEVRLSAAEALCRIGDPEGHKRLRAFVRDPDRMVRAYAILGAGRLNDPSMIPVLLDGIKDTGITVRETSVKGLSRHYEVRFRSTLARLARADSQISVRTEATRALLAQDADPFALRLGRRYFAQPLLLIEDIGREIRSYIIQIGTAIVLLLMTAGAFRSTRGLGPDTFPRVALAVAGVLGLWWGGLARGVSGSEENSLVFVILPSCAVVGYFARHKTRRAPELATVLRTATLRVFGAFYASFAVGLAWVWGFLGF